LEVFGLLFDLGGLADGRCPTDGQDTPSEFLSIQRANRKFRLRFFLEFDKAEPSGFARGAVLNNFDGADLEAFRLKPLGQRLFGLGERDIANKQSIQIAPPECSPEYSSGFKSGILNPLMDL
jgi:hypothetical protein